jgi:hypothetical protein
MMRAASSMRALTASAASSIAASKATFASSRLRLILPGSTREGLAHAGPKMRAATFSAASDCIPLMTCW